MNALQIVHMYRVYMYDLRYLTQVNSLVKISSEAPPMKDVDTSQNYSKTIWNGDKIRYKRFERFHLHFH